MSGFGVFKSSRRVEVVTLYTSKSHPNLLFRFECSTLKSVILQVLVTHGLLVHHPSICYAWLTLTQGMFGHELLRGGCVADLPGSVGKYIYGKGSTLGNRPQSLSLSLHLRHDGMTHSQSIPCCTFGGWAAAVVRNELVFVSHCRYLLLLTLLIPADSCSRCLRLTRCAGSAPLSC